MTLRRNTLSFTHQYLFWYIKVLNNNAKYHKSGCYYCFDNPAALKDQIYDHLKEEYSYDDYEILFNFFYSLYSLPNVILPLVNGFLIDKV